jgi:hypothetical protein
MNFTCELIAGAIEARISNMRGPEGTTDHSLLNLAGLSRANLK